MKLVDQGIRVFVKNMFAKEIKVFFKFYCAYKSKKIKFGIKIGVITDFAGKLYYILAERFEYS